MRTEDRIEKWYRIAQRQMRGYGFAPAPMREPPPDDPDNAEGWMDRLDPKRTGKFLILTDKFFDLLQPTEEERKIFMSDKPVWIDRSQDFFRHMGINGAFVGDNPMAAWVYRDKMHRRTNEDAKSD